MLFVLPLHCVTHCLSLASVPINQTLRHLLDFFGIKWRAVVLHEDTRIESDADA
jgi:hypothetical protein